MKGFIKFLSDIFDEFGVFKVSLTALSGLGLIFDLWQLFASANECLAIFSALCLLVTMAGHLGMVQLPGMLYGLGYLAPVSLWIMATISGIYPGLGDSGDYNMSALATALSTFVPLVGAAIISVVIFVKRLFEKS